MDAKQSRLRCWEITGCGRKDGCKVLDLAQSSGKECWEVVAAFDDFRSALNVCGDCVVVVYNRQHFPHMVDINEPMERGSGCSAHNICPGMRES